VRRTRGRTTAPRGSGSAQQRIAVADDAVFRVDDACIAHRRRTRTQHQAAGDTEQYLGSIGTPKWQSNTTIGYTRKRISTSLTFYTQSDTIRFNGSVPATIEQNAYLDRKGYAIYTLYVGYQLNDEVDVRFNVNNLSNKRWEEEAVGAIYSTVGRTFQFSINGRF
jgi:outer membrane receptor for ferrienterochelin and colicin